MLRPRPCHWFELITARDDLAPVLEALARAGAVELQTHRRHAAPLVIGGAGPALERFRELSKTCGSHWPRTRPAGATRVSDPALALGTRLAQLEAWSAEAQPLIAAREQVLAQQRLATDLQLLLRADPEQLPQPGLMAGAGQQFVQTRIFLAPARTPAFELPTDVLALDVAAPPGQADDAHFVVLVGAPAAMAEVDQHFAALKARRLVWPDDLRGSAAEAAAELARRQVALAQRDGDLLQQLQRVGERHGLAAALADLELVQWLIEHGSELAASERLVWVTGWTTEADAAAIARLLDGESLRCVVHFPDPPAGAQAPSVLANPPWARAFESFARMLGQPGADEADPSLLLALVAPLLFGFMFGDVGQGAVLCAAGWLLRKRMPMLVMLVPGGLMAMVFGLLFGTVFAREDLIPALWMHPLQHPVALLAAAVALGAVILLGGMALHALEAAWRFESLQWWSRDAGLVLAYVAVLASVLQRQALWLLPLGALWYVAGSMAASASGSTSGAAAGHPGPRLATLAAGLGAGLAQFVEQALQLFVNTVSFARVGAFALAHAGLSVAVVGVAEAAGGLGYWLVLLLGNLLILLLEGLVVGIQTTRLLLFEFFVRFLKGTGRAFRPLPPLHVHLKT
jgi:V/A-type H+-transporting ATPase subunit I